MKVEDAATEVLRRKGPMKLKKLVPCVLEKLQKQGITEEEENVKKIIISSNNFDVNDRRFSLKRAVDRGAEQNEKKKQKLTSTSEDADNWRKSNNVVLQLVHGEGGLIFPPMDNPVRISVGAVNDEVTEDELERFEQQLHECIPQGRGAVQRFRRVFVEKRAGKSQTRKDENILSVIEGAMAVFEATANADAKCAEERMAPTNYKLDEKLLTNCDFLSFRARVLDLFQWYDPRKTPLVSDTWMAPYFPVVQSSGMGKTKLLYELKLSDTTNLTSVLIECTQSAVDEVTHLYDHNFFNLDTSEGERDTMTAKLDSIVKKAQTERVVLCFDEAQHLLSQSDGWAFRVVRWWLRLVKPSHKKKVVAVFAGTSSRLANFYRDPPSRSTTSRGAKLFDYHEKGNELVPPFYELSTIGVTTKSPDVWPGKTEFDVAVRYGRPLFAFMAKNNELHNKEAGIMRRLLLSPSGGTDWTESSDACFAALATRLQMGQTSIATAERLVAHSYASLTFFSQKIGVANVVSWPDPVLARLAMCFMMQDKYRGAEVPYTKSLSTDFWAIKMREIFSSGLCVPDRGGVGEVAAALYLLLCGDTLRLVQDKTLRTLSVPLVDLTNIMFKPDTKPAGNSDQNIPRISFIQVCKNELRYSQAKGSNIKALDDQGLLKQLFDSSVATYNCANGKAYNMLASIRLIHQTTVYRPFAISIKSYEAISSSLVENALSDLFAQADREKARGGILMVFLHCCSSGDARKMQRGLCIAVRKRMKRFAKKFNKGNGCMFYEALSNYDTACEKRENIVVQKNQAIIKLKKAEESGLKEAVEESKKEVNIASALLHEEDREVSQLEKTVFDNQYSSLQARLQAEELVPIVFGVPEGDRFGVSDLVKSTTVGPAVSDILASHPFVRGLPSGADPAGLLRANTSTKSAEYCCLKKLITDNVEPETEEEEDN